MSAVPSKNKLRLLPVTAMVAAVLSWNCSGDGQETVGTRMDPETVATMRTTDVSTLISDSGVIRYHITSPLWLVFDEASEPHWRFPEGLFLEKFSETSIPEASITADSAKYFKNKQLWRLDGYVEITNTVGERFLSPQLFWDQKQQKVYSDSFIHIERADRIIEGYGFVSNDRMTKYEVLNVSGIFPSEQFRPGEDRGKAPRSDSAKVKGDTTRRSSGPRFKSGTVDENGAMNVIVPSNRKQVEAEKNTRKDKKNGLMPAKSIPALGKSEPGFTLRPGPRKKE